MSCTDPIADMLTAIRNAIMAAKDQVDVPHSRIKEGIARVLLQEGYVSAVSVLDTKPARTLRIALKYSDDGEPAIHRIQRVSTSGRRVYCGYRELRPVIRGYGIAILSTPAGILSDRECRRRRPRLGGEVLCTVQ
ncbi:MAG: 30S ribosomal protein S8 [Planctomycetota bacterium]|nr:30S ribosomal protein S8 [Planctomycetota bacterium]MCX8040825.1 30S ribosomal protein S8 [Planctomycetota bacterium]MDW8372276.1 30S ribosomal protein S8 [Planctomycetota bacterium]